MHHVYLEEKSPDKLSATALKIRLHREKKARKAAESLIEEKSQELFAAKKEQEQILLGGIKMLTDVLALARPELFQKAAKVQRWARRIAPKLKVKRPWELDLAAMLYPLGIVSLPDELALKYAHNEPLNDEEQELIDESAQTAYQLIYNIERMRGVAEAIRYSRKGFDGSGLPRDGIKGKEIPRSSRILKVLIDLADASTGEHTTRADGFMKLAAHKQEYDLEILKTCYIELLEVEEKIGNDKLVLYLLPGLLKVHDIVAKDIVDIDNKLLLASGQELSVISIERLRDLANKGRLKGKIKIIRSEVNQEEK